MSTTLRPSIPERTRRKKTSTAGAARAKPDHCDDSEMSQSSEREDEAEEEKGTEHADHEGNSVAPRPLRDAGTTCTANSLHDYLFRSATLEQLSWYEMTEQYVRCAKSKGRPSMKSVESSFDFLPDHPMAASHVLRRRDRPCIPAIYGSKVPDRRKLEHADVEEQNTYGVRAYLLLVPFRLADLSSATGTQSINLRESAYQAWTATCKSWLSQTDEPGVRAFTYRQRILDNIQCYWEGSERSEVPLQGAGASGNGQEEEQDTSDLLNCDDLIEPPPPEPEDPALLAALHACGVLDNLPAVTMVGNQHLEEPCSPQELNRRKKTQFRPSNSSSSSGLRGESSVEIMPADISHAQLTDATTCTDGVEPADVAARADWIPHSGVADDEPVRDLPDSLAQLVQSLHAAKVANTLRFAPPTSNPHAASAIAVMQHVLQRFKLNAKQSRVFLLMARQFFRSHFQLDLSPPAPTGGLNAAVPMQTQQLLYMGGAAGTGKSHVIESICFLFRVFDMRASVIVTALTGAAAVTLQAPTLHSALNIGMRQVAAPGAEMSNKFASTSLLIIDEISMMGVKLLYDLNLRLRGLKNMRKPFGGLSVLFVGDFCQFPPVGALSLMTLKSTAGGDLWRDQVTAVVMLDEQMRQAEDPEFASHLQRFRDGNVDDASIAYFNTRCKFPSEQPLDAAAVITASLASCPPEPHNMAAPSATPANHESRAFVPIVVADNKHRVSFNRAIFMRLEEQFRQRQERSAVAGSSKATALPFFRIDATYSQGQASSVSYDLSDQARAHVMAAQVNGFEHSLMLYAGMEVIISKNLALSQGIANGSRAVVQRIQLHPGLREPVVDAQATSMRVLRAAADVACVIVRLKGAQNELSNIQFEDHLGPGEFCVYIKNELVQTAVKGRQFHILQFPLLPAFCITAHKTQGLTIPRLILAQTLSKTPRYLYVVLSRLKSISGLQLLAPLPSNPVHGVHSAYKRGVELEQELKRLTKLECETFTNNAAFFASVTGTHTATIHGKLAWSPAVAQASQLGSKTAPASDKNITAAEDDLSRNAGAAARAQSNSEVTPTVTEETIMCVPGRGDCGFWAILLSLLCPHVNDETRFNSTLQRVIAPLHSSGAGTDIPRVPQLLRPSTADSDLRAYLSHYLLAGRSDSGWLERFGSLPPQFSRVCVYFQQLTRYLREITFHYMRHDASFHEAVALDQLKQYTEDMSHHGASKDIDAADMKVVASLLGLRLTVEDMPFADNLEPVGRWARADVIPVKIRYVNFLFQPDGPLNHFVGILSAGPATGEVAAAPAMGQDALLQPPRAPRNRKAVKLRCPSKSSKSNAIATSTAATHPPARTTSRTGRQTGNIPLRYRDAASPEQSDQS